MTNLSETSSENLLKNLLKNFINCATVAQSLINQATVYEEQGNRELAIVFYQRGISLYPYSIKVYQQLKNLNVSLTNNQPKKSQEYCQLGNQYLEKRAMFEAIIAYETAIFFNQENALAYQKLGDILINLEQWQTASHVLEMAILLKPDFPWNYQKLGEAYSHLEQWFQAKQAYEQTIKLMPDFPWAYHKLAKVQTQLGEITEAIINYQQAIKLKPDAWESWEKLIQLFIQLKQYGEAIAHCQELQKINPQLAWPWGLLGDIYCQQEAYKQAIEAYQTSIQVKSDYGWGYLKLADLFSSQGNLSVAIDYYQRALEYQPKNWELYRKVALFFRELGDTEQAIATYEKLLAINPNLPGPHEKIGDIWEVAENFTQALIAYQKASEIEPNFLIYKKLGTTYHKLKQVDHAINAHLESIKLNPNYPWAYHDLWNILSKKGDWDYAIQLYEKILKIEPQAAYLWSYLGNAYTEKKQWQQAIDCYRKAIIFNPDLPEPYQHLAEIFRREELWDLVTKYYLKAVEMNPEYDWEIVDLWTILNNRQHLDKAIRIYEKIIHNKSNSINAYINLAKIYLRKDSISSAIQNNRLASYYQTCQSHPDYMQQYNTKSWQEITLQLPKFLIIGVGKGGTTAIFDYLTKHPQFLSPILKEIDFWSMKFQYGIDWYLSHFPVIADQTQWITGEASPSYLGSWPVAERLKKYLPQIRLIIILRNPVDRAISHYYHHVKIWQENRSCKDAMNYELNILRSNNDYNFYHYWKDQLYYLGPGIYIKFIEHWFKFFEREQFLILSSEEFEKTPNIVMSKVYDFLEISDYQLKKYSKIHAGFYPSLDNNLRQELDDYFRPYNQQLQDFLQRDFGW